MGSLKSLTRYACRLTLPGSPLESSDKAGKARFTKTNRHEDVGMGNAVNSIEASRSDVSLARDAWAKAMAFMAKAKMSGEISATLTPYRVGSVEFLSVDLVGSAGGDMSLTFCADRKCADYSLDDMAKTSIGVPNIVEARTMTTNFLMYTNAQLSLRQDLQEEVAGGRV